MVVLQRFILILTLVIFAIPGEAPAAARLEPLTVAYSTFSGAYLPLWIAVEEQRERKQGLGPAFKEINAEKILPLSMEEVQANYRKYLDEFRNYFGK